VALPAPRGFLARRHLPCASNAQGEYGGEQTALSLGAAGGTVSALAAKAATATIPIVFGVAVDPVEVGLVASLSRPGGNLTGVTNLNAEVGPKRLELLHELLPAAPSLGVLVDPTSPTLAEAFSRRLEPAAHALGVKLHVLHASTASVAHQTAGRGKLAILEDRRHRVAGGQSSKLFAPAGEKRSRPDDETACSQLNQGWKNRIEIAFRRSTASRAAFSARSFFRRAFFNQARNLNISWVREPNHSTFISDRQQSAILR
jgi:ABC transporter substrate binding protein